MYGFMTTGLLELQRYQRQLRKPKRPRGSRRRFKQRIYWRDGGTCKYCHRTIPYREATLEHITPVAQEGEARQKENIALACVKCNQKKGVLLFLDLPEDLTPEALKAQFALAQNGKEKPPGPNKYFLSA